MTATTEELRDLFAQLIDHDRREGISAESTADGVIAFAKLGRAQVLDLTAERDQLRGAEVRVRALHQQYRDVYAVGDENSCAHCNQLSGTVIRWPCPTIAALDGLVELTPKPCEKQYLHDPHTWTEYRREHHCAGDLTYTAKEEAL